VSVSDVLVDEVDLTEFRIIALGDNECTIAFEAKSRIPRISKPSLLISKRKSGPTGGTSVL
jgi:hypothetical protein